MVYLTVNNAMMGAVSFGYFLLVVILFGTNYVLFENILNFVLSPSVAKMTSRFLVLISLLVNVQSIYMVKLHSWFVYSTSILPLSFLGWMIEFGFIAFNKGLVIEIGNVPEIVSGIDVSTVFQISLYCFLVKLLFFVYCWPVVVNNDNKKLRGFAYLCKAEYWRSCCDRSSADVEEQADQITDDSESVAARLIGGDEDAEFQVDPNSVLTAAERAMIEQGTYERFDRPQTTETLTISGLTKTVNKKAIIDDVNITAFSGQALVFIGENGSGKSKTL